MGNTTVNRTDKTGADERQQPRLNRRDIEQEILKKFFPADSFVWRKDGETETLDIGVKTQANNVYLLRVKVPRRYPHLAPEVWVVYPNPLRSFDGEIIQPGVETHSLERTKEGLQICLYYDGMVEWNPQYTLYHAIIKGRTWLECYEAHLITGERIDIIAGKKNSSKY